MNAGKRHWTKVMFIDKAKLWLHWMDLNWKQAPKAVRNIKKILRKYNIEKGRCLELVDMGEKAGLQFKEAYHSSLTLQPAQADSAANLVFQKTQKIDSLVPSTYNSGLQQARE